MKTLFDCETEIGISEAEAGTTAPAPEGNSQGWKLFVHTQATLTRAKGMLKIEQRCFYRQGNEVSEFPDVKPDLLLEPALDTEEESLSLVRGIHSRFIERVRQCVGDSSFDSARYAAS